MCLASQREENMQKAKVGDKVRIEPAGHLHQPAFTINGCAVCVPFGAVVSFTHLPGSIRARVGVLSGPVEARMVSYDGERTEFYENRDDVFEVINQTGGTQRFSLSELAGGTSCTILRIEQAPDFSRAVKSANATRLPPMPPIEVQRQGRLRLRDLVRI